MGDESLAVESALLKSSAGPAESFTVFALQFEPRLRRGLIPALGVDLATDAAAEALAYGWEHWDRVGAMENPQGYLYRVARTAGRRLRRRPVAEPVTRQAIAVRRRLLPSADRELRRGTEVD